MHNTFLVHPTLQPTEGGQMTNVSIAVEVQSSGGDDEHEEEDDEEDIMVDTEATSKPRERETLSEWVVEDIQVLWDFCDGMEYQLQFDDHRMFQTMEQEGAVFMQFARSCLSCETQLNSTRGQHHRHGEEHSDVLLSKTTTLRYQQLIDQSHDPINKVPFWTASSILDITCPFATSRRACYIHTTSS